jgi:uncharacterized phage-associated protein
VQDVAAFILHERGPMTVMKLQKLCYYSYGYHLAWESRQLFPERFQAWANGPVSPALYKLHKGKFELFAGDIVGDPDALDEGERESVRLVLNAYGDFTAHQLSLMTHSEPPWQAARRRARAAPLEPSTALIRDGDVYEYFDALTSADDNARSAEG